ncbi:MAG: hypothetical protein H6871_04750 [Methylobacteriaceae bacterium]|nr:hypothetical protein [Methylobacteriaceae bacterium]
MRQKGREFAIVPFLKIFRPFGKFVVEFDPGPVGVAVEIVPVVEQAASRRQRHELERPDQDLAKVAHSDVAHFSHAVLAPFAGKR